MKIAVLDWYTVNISGDIPVSQLEELGDVRVIPLTPPEETAANIGDADIVLCNKVLITKEVMDACPNIKYVGLFATGFNNVDIEYAAEKGIVVCNAGQYSTMSVAQHVFSFILNRSDKVSEFDSRVKAGEWERSDVFCLLDDKMTELNGKTMGIFGFGSIGHRVAEIAKAFGMNVIVTTRTQRDNDVEYVSFDELLKRSDYISVHCPLTDATKEVFNAEAFKKCKKTCMFINTSRGGTVNEQALADALNNDTIAAAAVDVLAYEPMRKDCPLKKAKNITFTPHVAWAAAETRERLVNIVYKNIEGFVSGNIINRVN